MAVEDAFGVQPTLGVLLRAARTALDEDQAVAAVALGLRQSIVSRVESDTRMLKDDPDQFRRVTLYLRRAVAKDPALHDRPIDDREVAWLYVQARLARSAAKARLV